MKFYNLTKCVTFKIEFCHLQTEILYCYKFLLKSIHMVIQFLLHDIGPE